jgi:ASC-1-like (ASCH) protein
LKFVSERRLDLPRNVTLNFGNGETFACEVVREIDGKEFGLKFGDMSEFAESKIKADIDAVYQFTRSKSPMEICDTMEKVDFFGDQELEAAVRDYAAAYDRMIELYRERIFPHQRSGTVS